MEKERGSIPPFFSAEAKQTPPGLHFAWRVPPRPRGESGPQAPSSDVEAGDLRGGASWPTATYLSTPRPGFAGGEHKKGMKHHETIAG